MKVEILESAHQDLMDGYWFYENQSAGLTIEGGLVRVYGILDDRRDPSWILRHLNESKRMS